jgi:hypothetical protein
MAHRQYAHRQLTNVGPDALEEELKKQGRGYIYTEHGYMDQGPNRSDHSAARRLGFAASGSVTGETVHGQACCRR